MTTHASSGVDLTPVIEDLQTQITALRRTVEAQQSAIESLTQALTALAERPGNARR